MIDSNENAAFEQLQAKTSEKFKLILSAAASSNDLVFNHSWNAKKPGLIAIPAEESYWKAICQREDATRRAMSFSSEYIATEASKSLVLTLPDTVNRHFKNVSDLLDQKLPEGPRGVEMRRAYLAHVEEHLPSSAHWKPEVQGDGPGKLYENLRKAFPSPQDLRNRETGYVQRSLTTKTQSAQRYKADTEFAENLTSRVAALHTAIGNHTRSGATALRGIEAGQDYYSALERRINALPKDSNSSAFEGTKAARLARHTAAKPRVFREYLLDGNLQLDTVAKTIFKRQQNAAIRAVTPIGKRSAEPILDSPNTSTRAQGTPGPWIKRRRLDSQSEISSTARNASPLTTVSQQLGDADASPSHLSSTPQSTTIPWMRRHSSVSTTPESQVSPAAHSAAASQTPALDNREGERARGGRSLSQ